MKNVMSRSSAVSSASLAMPYLFYKRQDIALISDTAFAL
jgi:hypothetical protein